MGKPFAKELEKIKDTCHWASQAELKISKDYLDKIQSSCSLIVGSGGSLSACYFLAMLRQQAGYISKAITPLDLFSAKETIPSATVIFISASGKNTDILFAHELCVVMEAENIFSICMKAESRLAGESKKYSISRVMEFDLPTGKDGFLATNSLVAYFVILKRIFDTSPAIELPAVTGRQIDAINKFTGSLGKYFTLTLLYSGWGLPVAIDIESKLTEAGLGNSHMADFRNFAHGRHNWFDKKNKEAAIVAIITTENEEIAEKTLSLLPPQIPVLRLRSNQPSADASIDLLIQSFYLVKQIGELVSIDPGRPGVPSYGSKLYKLKYGNAYIKEIKAFREKGITVPIIRKVGYRDYLQMNGEEKSYWKNALLVFKTKLQQEKFGGIVFDYDGTLCDADQRYDPPKEEIKSKLISLLQQKSIIAIATGRGQSVRKDLQEFIPGHLWDRVIIGYYNCSQIGLLNNNDLPKKDSTSPVLDEVANILQQNYYVWNNIVLESKPGQVEIKIKNKMRSTAVKKAIFDLLVAKFFGDIKILESSHSVDIITSDISKRHILAACKTLAAEHGLPGNFICIGDKGKWPGNDYGLLSGEYSLSVDEVSADPASCWNLAGPGIRNSEATLEYLDAIETSLDGSIRINLHK